MMILDISLNNKELYKGCTITEVAGRLNLTTPVADAINIVGTNAEKIVKGMSDHSEITLTGAMAVWSYLLVFHSVVHRFTSVFYDDGRNGKVLIAQHGTTNLPELEYRRGKRMKSTYPKVMQYIKETRRWQMNAFKLALIGAILCVVGSMIFASGDVITNVWSGFGSIINVVTIVMTAFVWYNGVQRDWEEDLPKRLNVTFRAPQDDSKPDDIVDIMTCKMAQLSDEGDIRQWAQQIGSQMVTPKGSEKPEYLKFTPDPRSQQIIGEPDITVTAGGEDCKVYSVTITLMTAPDLIRAAINDPDRGEASWIREWDCGKSESARLDNKYWSEAFEGLSKVVVDKKKAEGVAR
jgi:hypothetical protein